MSSVPREWRYRKWRYGVGADIRYGTRTEISETKVDPSENSCPSDIQIRRVEKIGIGFGELVSAGMRPKAEKV
ncbi:MAG: hypothetical protein WCT01_05430 [Candidatus Shapirobacteria bacterium]